MSAKVITHPSALAATLVKSIELAERGELPVQVREASGRQARVDALRTRATRIAVAIGERMRAGGVVNLLPDFGWGGELASIHEQLEALGVGEE